LTRVRIGSNKNDRTRPFNEGTLVAHNPRASYFSPNVVISVIGEPMVRLNGHRHRHPPTKGTRMDPHAKQSTAKEGAQKYFRKAQDNETLAKHTRKKERAADATKTAKLRGLRLAKEAEDKAVADKQAAENDVSAPTERRKRSPTVKPAGMVRMRY
jgi:hypothetical protein